MLTGSALTHANFVQKTKSSPLQKKKKQTLKIRSHFSFYGSKQGKLTLFKVRKNKHSLRCLETQQKVLENFNLLNNFNIHSMHITIPHLVNKKITKIHICFFVHSHLLHICIGGARGVMVIVVGTGHGDTSSNPGRD